MNRATIPLLLVLCSASMVSAADSTTTAAPDLRLERRYLTPGLTLVGAGAFGVTLGVVMMNQKGYHTRAGGQRVLDRSRTDDHQLKGTVVFVSGAIVMITGILVADHKVPRPLEQQRIRWRIGPEGVQFDVDF